MSWRWTARLRAIHFFDVTFGARLAYKHRVIDVDGFYDGDGKYKVRFMPDTEGEWSYTTRSNVAALDGKTDTFICTPASANNHGPVRVRNTYHFAYADGTPHFSVGTTCYVWNHQGDALEEQTLETLKTAPFNKMRMCVFPKHYTFNQNEPPYHAFPLQLPPEGESQNSPLPLGEGAGVRVAGTSPASTPTSSATWSSAWVTCATWASRPTSSSSIPTTAGATARCPPRWTTAICATSSRGWRPIATSGGRWRTSSTLMQAKTEQDWDRFFQIVQESDPYQHLRSVHNCRVFYDHNKPWVTHCSVQRSDLRRSATGASLYKKPVVVDECCYEGNIPHNWGNITAQEMTHRFWEGFSRGGYVGHGETYLHPEDILWWSKGGVLHGDSPARIAFLRQIMEAGPAIDPRGAHWDLNQSTDAEDTYRLIYFGINRPAYKDIELPADGAVLHRGHRHLGNDDHLAGRHILRQVPCESARQTLHRAANTEDESAGMRIL